MRPLRESLLDLFSTFESSDATFLAYDDGFRYRAYSYRQLSQAAHALAQRFSTMGARPGDKILLWAENRPEWVAALWAAMVSGMIAVPIDYRSSPAMVLAVQRSVAAKLIVTGDETPQNPLPGVPAIPAATILFPERAQTPLHPVSKDDIVEIIFTSGATSEPKGVTITHRNVLANLIPIQREIARYSRYSKPFRPIRFLNLLPLSHLFGQTMATFIPPMIEGTVAFIRGYNPEDIVRMVHTRRISVIVSVPRILEVLREHILRLVPEAAHRLTGVSWPRRWWHFRRVHRLLGWKFWAFVVGAAPLDPALEGFWSNLGYVVIQGYGLTETAPVVTVNHPFHRRAGSVGKPLSGVEVKIAPDGEILVRGENVTSGYYGMGPSEAFEEGWLHTGDIGSLDADGRLTILGRKKEMIVTPEGLNVFPEDIEKVLNSLPGVRESAVVAERTDSRERVHAVLVLAPDASAEQVVNAANLSLEDHQKIRGVSVWPGQELPRTEGTAKLKRHAIQQWVSSGADKLPATVAAKSDALTEVLKRYAGNRSITPETTLDDLGLSSLDRVEIVLELETKLNRSFDEGALATKSTVAEIRAASEASAPPPEPFAFPEWNRSVFARALRRVALPFWLLPMARIFAWISVRGKENLAEVDGPVIFAANHQSHFDTPILLTALPARHRYRVAPAMSKEFFRAHFYPQEFPAGAVFARRLEYYLAALFFNAFPFPQRESGTRQTMRYTGELTSDGWSILIFPEGKRTEEGEITRFFPGVGMLASRLHVPVVPVRIDGAHTILHRSHRFPRPGKVTVTFGAPMHFDETDFAAIARKIEEAVRVL
ncbi:MAG: AMP-binding protein [Bryobacterales bacterium]|nr:AMP-binding protein [Bryobacterales bacterium]